MAILATQKVLTLDYWKIASDLKPGDIVFDRYGNKTTIKLVQSFRAQNCYRVWFTDGRSIAGDANLKLPLETEHYRNVARIYQGVRQFGNKPRITSLEQLTEMPLVIRPYRNEYSIATAGPLNFPHQTLPVPPFVFGYWFFNRRSNGLMTIDPQYKDFVFEKFKDAGYKVIEKKISHNNIRFFTTSPTVLSHLIPLIPIKIPNNYLLASAEQRFELLSGILHVKKNIYNEKRRQFRFSNPKKAILSQVQYLADSLGCKTIYKNREDVKTHTIVIKTRLHITKNHKPKENKIHQNCRQVMDVEPIEPQGCIHIETNNPETGILVGEGFITCH